MDESSWALPSEKEYRALSRSFRYYKLAALALCLMFIVGGLIVFRDDITVENFRYLVRYLDTGSGDLTSSEALLNFDAGEASGGTAKIYKNDLILVNRNNFEVFDFHHGKIFNDTFSMTQPSVSVSDVHTMVYDMGGKRLRLYNSFSLVKEYAYDYPIFCADTADGGRYAVATSEKNYHCAVYVYNAAHDRIFRWLSADKYIYDLALADGSDRLAIATVRAEQGELLAELSVFSSSDSEISFHYSFAGEMPLKTYVDGQYARLLTDRALHTVDTQSGEIRSVAVDHERLSMYHFSKDFSAIVLNDNTVGVRQEVLICTKQGELSHTAVVNEQILDMDHYGESLYFLTDAAVVRIRFASGETLSYPVEEIYSQLLMAGEQSAVLVSSSCAKLTQLSLQSKTPTPSGEVS